MEITLKTDEDIKLLRKGGKLHAAIMGELLTAVKPGISTLDLDDLAMELIDHCRERIAHFKCPRTVDLVLALPRDDNGKLYRRKLLQQYRDGTAT